MKVALKLVETKDEENSVRDVFVSLGPIDAKNAETKLVSFVMGAGEQLVRAYAAAVNICLNETLRHAILKWPSKAGLKPPSKAKDKENEDTIVAHFAQTEAGAALLNAWLVAKNGTEDKDGKPGLPKNKFEEKRLARKWVYAIQTFTDARILADKVQEAHEAGFKVKMVANSANIRVFDSKLDHKDFTIAGFGNANFVGKTVIGDIAGQKRGRKEAEPITFSNSAAMLPVVKAMSAHLSKWAENPKNISDSLRAELSTLAVTIAEVLDIELTAEQDATLSKLSEVSETDRTSEKQRKQTA